MQLQIIIFVALTTNVVCVCIASFTILLVRRPFVSFFNVCFVLACSFLSLFIFLFISSFHFFSLSIFSFFCCLTVFSCSSLFHFVFSHFGRSLRFSQYSRVLFNFSTDHVSFCHKTPNLFCRLCFYKQTLIIIMWQVQHTFFFFARSFSHFPLHTLLPKKKYFVLIVQGKEETFVFSQVEDDRERPTKWFNNRSRLNVCSDDDEDGNDDDDDDDEKTKLRRSHFIVSLKGSLTDWFIRIIHAYEIFMKITNW